MGFAASVTSFLVAGSFTTLYDKLELWQPPVVVAIMLAILMLWHSVRNRFKTIFKTLIIGAVSAIFAALTIWLLAMYCESKKSYLAERLSSSALDVIPESVAGGWHLRPLKNSCGSLIYLLPPELPVEARLQNVLRPLAELGWEIFAFNTQSADHVRLGEALKQHLLALQSTKVPLVLAGESTSGGLLLSLWSEGRLNHMVERVAVLESPPVPLSRLQNHGDIPLLLAHWSRDREIPLSIVENSSKAQGIALQVIRGNDWSVGWRALLTTDTAVDKR